ncbi:hypothetical protein H6F75_27600 [Nodosilinea sp. FACHB-131]|uniref:hypothetical protein n=1 Tax=Cyanophyceae TaxID=3028117 RepID=UPI0016893E7F|nr:hypothetical protein [Nodosilinea sp. FACHB-131]MBD1877250.1 hypothetical protein [Nodosilinea sp. FACHB-131]
MATIQELVSIGAPLFGAVLGGPPGLAAGAISLIINALGLPSNYSVQDITKEVQADPEAASRLRELELNNQQYLLGLKLQIEQAEHADRANARAREVAITNATGSRDWFAAGLGVFVVLAFTLVLCSMIFRPTRSESQRDPNTSALINILVGALTAGYSTVLSYYFGSSSGSKNKDETIALLTQPPESRSTQVEPPPPSPPLIIPSTASTVPRKTWRDE